MRGNASAPMTLADVSVGADRALCRAGQGARHDARRRPAGLPGRQRPPSRVGIAEAAVRATHTHLTRSALRAPRAARSPSCPTLRARLAQMRIETDRARAHLVGVLDSLESAGPGDAAARARGEGVGRRGGAMQVTDTRDARPAAAPRSAGALGARALFRDARAPIVMAPTTDQAYDFIGRALCGMELF